MRVAPYLPTQTEAGSGMMSAALAPIPREGGVLWRTLFACPSSRYLRQILLYGTPFCHHKPLLSPSDKE